MKKLFAILLLVPFLFLAACQGEEPVVPPGPPGPPPGPVETTYKDFDTWNEWLEYKYEEEFGWDAKAKIEAGQNPLGEKLGPITMSAEEFLFSKGINAGWNLGNTYDLVACPRANDAGSNYPALMAGAKAAGINVIRMPVTWGSNIGAAPGYTVTASWLDNVQAAVDAAYDAGLVIFFNTHHDKGTFSLQNASAAFKADGEDGEAYKTNTEKFTAFWNNVAERFKDYGPWLIFEDLNEPTVNGPGGSVQWDGAAPEVWQVLNRWNQAFVDTVRLNGGINKDGTPAAGGTNNNAKRYLIFKPYAAKYFGVQDPTNGFLIPEDSAGPGRLCFSFHSYVPQPLALEGQGFNWNAGFVSQFTTLFAQAQLFLQLQGIPLFMGETGATFHSKRSGNDSINANRNRLMSLNALGNQARRFGVVPCLWDNGAMSSNDNGEAFAMLRRRSVHDSDNTNYGLPVDYTKATGIITGNAVLGDTEYGAYALRAFTDAVNGCTPSGQPVTLGKPRLSPKLLEKYCEMMSITEDAYKTQWYDSAED